MAMSIVSPSLSFRRQIFLPNHHKHKPNPKTARLTFFPPKSSISASTQTLPTPSHTHHQSFSPSQSIQSLSESGDLNEAFQLLQRNPNNADSVTSLLQVCGQKKDLELGRKIHEMVSKSNHLRDDLIISTRLITMYAMCESPVDARFVFDQLETKNLYQWNALISGYNRNELWFDSMLTFCELISSSGFRPDNYTMPVVVKACGGLLSVEIGRVVHGMAMKMGLCSDAYVCNALIAMYGKCGHANEAVQMFDEMPERNVVSWNAMMFGFSESGLLGDSLATFRAMLLGDDCLTPDVATLVTILPVCAEKGDVETGRVVHGLAVKLELNQELKVCNALLDMYVKCGCMSEAQTLFSKNAQRNVVSWNVMIGGYSREGDVYGTFNLLHRMQTEEGEPMRPNAITILNVLPACLEMSELQRLKELHGYAYRSGFHNNDLVADAFVSSYANCGSLASADYVFDNMETKTVSSWDALILGYAQNGAPRKAFDLFLHMTSLGLKPDSYSIGFLLLACGNLNSLRDGKVIHGFSVRNGFESESFFGTSLISFYNQCGKSLYSLAFSNETQERNLMCGDAVIARFSQDGIPDKAINLYR